ncbi:MAG: GNAT family N-acetyltransferase [Chloroflexi bacterium]|nr:GNAT family N-acetyltransferase [Chloroflexota bacterium]
MSSPVSRSQSRSAAGRGALKPQLEMVRSSNPVPEVPRPAAGYSLRNARPEDRHSYSQTFQTAFDEPSPFADLMRKTLPGGFFVVEHKPTGTIVAASTAASYPKAQHPDGYSLQWVVAHSDHLGTGSGRAATAAATQVLADSAPAYSYLSTDDFRLPAINIYLKLGWQPLLFQDDQTARWSEVFEKLGMWFDEKEWPTTPQEAGV